MKKYSMSGLKRIYMHYNLLLYFIIYSIDYVLYNPSYKYVPIYNIQIKYKADIK